MSDSTSTTSRSLLRRVCGEQRDEKAWKELVERYAPLINAWALRQLRSAQDADDVTQEVLLAVWEKLPGFAYDPEGSFQRYLRVVVRNAVADYVKARGRAGRGSGDEAALERLANVEAQDALAEEIERQSKRELYQAACERVQLLVGWRSWQAYKLTQKTELGGEGLSGQAAADQLKINRGLVYQLKRNVIAAIRAEMVRLDAEESRG